MSKAEQELRKAFIKSLLAAYRKNDSIPKEWNDMADGFMGLVKDYQAKDRAERDAYVWGDDWYCEEYEPGADSKDCILCGEAHYKHKGLLMRQRAEQWDSGNYHE